jgi:uncharacterized hydrophobic protein (TIGR00271 family)
MEENQNQNNNVNKRNLKRPARLFFVALWKYIRELVNLTDDTDSDATIANISKGVEFKGDNVWVLFFAIIIASVGLNVNSTAVIIGAMLVSPLMGPIMGIGLSIGIGDNALLKKSLRNIFTMMMIALLASSLYFLLTPLSDAQSELLARTQPTIFDVFIAFFGGCAGILASSRKQEKMTVVSGVAIATALMPPLCTAGYGLGTGQLVYFFGAFYLFFINAFFIALATYLMVRYLKFPRTKYLDPSKERRVRRSILIFSIIVIVPSVFIALDVVKETSFNSQAIMYVAEMEKSSAFADAQIVNQSRSYSSKGSSITLSLVGKPLEEGQIADLQRRLDDFGLKNTNLVIKQAGGGTLDVGAQATMLQNFIESKERMIVEKDSIIDDMQQQLLAEHNRALVSSEQIAREISVLYPEVKSISLGQSTSVNVKNMKSDTVPTINIYWKKPPQKNERKNITDWLYVRLNTKNLSIQHINE